MTPTDCPACAHPMGHVDVVCPQCGFDRGVQREFTPGGYEWRSHFTWIGLPLAHVAFGCDHDGHPRTARGIVAIGQRATGVVAIGIVARGFFACGVVCFGGVTLGVVSVAAIAAGGVNAIAPIAFGVTAFGYAVGGLQPLGWKLLAWP